MTHQSNSHRLRECGDVVYELHHDQLDEVYRIRRVEVLEVYRIRRVEVLAVYRIRRVEVLAVCESREAARQWMLDHEAERKRAVARV
jgi:hypothetical protein